MTKLHGFVRLSSCALMSLLQASRQAPDEPGNTKINVALATPARALDCSDEVSISS